MTKQSFVDYLVSLSDIHHYLMTQYGVKPGAWKIEAADEGAVKKELLQFDGMKTFQLLLEEQLCKEERKEPLSHSYY